MDYINSSMDQAIEECVHSQLHRIILKLRFIDGWTYEKIAEAVDRTPRQVSNIIFKYYPTVFEYLREMA